MAGVSGATTAAAIQRKVSDCHVVMVSGTEPDSDIIEMEIDDYVTKPVTGSELNGMVERMIARTTFRREMEELFSLASIKATLETEQSSAALATDEEYRELSRQLTATRERLSAAHTTAEMEWDELFEACDPDLSVTDSTPA